MMPSDIIPASQSSIDNSAGSAPGYSSDLSLAAWIQMSYATVAGTGRMEMVPMDGVIDPYAPGVSEQQQQEQLSISSCPSQLQQELDANARLLNSFGRRSEPLKRLMDDVQAIDYSLSSRKPLAAPSKPPPPAPRRQQQQPAGSAQDYSSYDSTIDAVIKAYSQDMVDVDGGGDKASGDGGADVDSSSDSQKSLHIDETVQVVITKARLLKYCCGYVIAWF